MPIPVLNLLIFPYVYSALDTIHRFVSRRFIVPSLFPYLAMSRHVLALFPAVAYFSPRDSLYTGSTSNQNIS